MCIKMTINMPVLYLQQYIDKKLFDLFKIRLYHTAIPSMHFKLLDKDLLGISFFMYIWLSPLIDSYVPV